MVVASKPLIQLDAVNALARALAGAEFRARAIVERACAAVAEGLEFERVGILRLMPDGETLVPFAAHGLTHAETAVLPAALPRARVGAFERARASGEACFVEVPAPEDFPEEVVRGFGIDSFVVVPLLSEGRCLGFMTCDQRGAPFSLDRSDLELLTTFGSLISAFLERAIVHGRLRRLNELQRQFAALASHELRTPVAAIYGAARTLDERGAELPTEQQAELRALLSQQSLRLLELVENVLDLSRLEGDSIRISPVEMPVAARLEELIAANLDGQPSVLDAPGELAAVVDPYAFDRIVSNLLGNAARHGAPPVVVTARREQDELHVTVEDRGAGVPPEFVDSLFERFTRASASREGAGLGLSIALAYAQAHGGTLRYEPAEPHGARFCLVLPSPESS